MQPSLDLLPALSESDVFALHEQLLVRNLQRLRMHKTSARTRAEVREWLDATDERPFSFAACARACGCDPDELREQLSIRLRRRERPARRFVA